MVPSSTDAARAVALVIPFVQFTGNNFMLMQDNARPHTARIVTQYLNDVEVRKMDWPSRCPDLNPIEHVWDLEQSKEAPTEEWDQIDQNQIRQLIQGMPRRMEAAIRARGGIPAIVFF